MASRIDKPSLAGLEKRRRSLGMTYALVAKESGVSMPTVVRILSGRHAEASFANVAKIADALGMTVSIAPKMSAGAWREQQARAKAARLIGLLQGTSGLEGQALTPSERAELLEQTVHELLAGSKRKLWRE